MIMDCLFLFSMLLTAGATAPAEKNSSPPETRVDTVEEVIHGVKIADPYRWLEDQQSPATREWIDRQNRRTERELSRFSGRDQIAHRLGELMKVDSVSLPTARGNRYFFSKQEAARDLPVICLREGRDGADQILIDPDQLSSDGSKTVSLLDVSHDGKLLAYGIRIGGEDELEVHFFDVDKRHGTPDLLERGRYFGVSLSRDSKTLFYARHGREGSCVYRRGLGAGAEKETLIFGEGYDAGVGISPGLSEDGRYLLINVWYGSAAKKTEIHAWDLTGDKPIVPIIKDIEARFSGGAVDNRLFVQTNWQAPNGRVLEIDLESPERARWKEIIPEQKTAALQGFSLVANRLYVNYLDNVVSSVRVFDTSGAHHHDISFPTLGTVSGAGGEWSGGEAFFVFNSFHVPSTIFGEDAATRAKHIWARTSVPFDSDRFEVQQVTFPSNDKTKIPMFLVHRKGLTLDGNNPTLLSGYGGFNISLTPAFSTRAALWIEQGGVYAVANLRGGGEFGETWHESGMLERKQNVFDDFLSAARWLIDNRYTRPDRLAITGRSNGGLLVGAALTQAPELFQAVICGYPLLDMIRYHQFLVAKFWVPEYGSSDDAAQFRTLLAYSPYHHVKPGTKYPAALFLTGDADTRVDPLHARKMTALVQAATASDRPVLLKYDTKLGHVGARPISQSIDDLTDEFCFLFEQLGVTFRDESDGARSGSNGKPAAKAAAGDSRSATAALQALFDEEWEWGLREDPMFASHLGDPRYNDRWPDASLQAFDRRHGHRQDVVKKLDAIDPRLLPANDRLNYRLFRRQYELDVEEYPFQWHLIPVNHRDGIQDAGSLADVLRFAALKDYSDWLARLDRFPVYMDQTIELMRAGIKEKMLLPKVVMERVTSQIHRQIVDDPEKSLFYKPLRSFPDEIPPADRQKIMAVAKAAITGKIVPAYRKFAEFFEKEYLPACPDQVGAWQLPHGKELYEFRARQFTTTSLTPEEIHELGLREVRRIHGEMEAIVKQVGFQGTFQQFLEKLRTDSQFYFKDANELLAAYQVLCKKIDPQLPKLFRKLPRIPYGVEAIPEHMAPDTTTAYYRQPSADGSRAGTYFVNLYRPEVRPKYEMEALSLHEAVPGHHLQIALATELEGLPTFRRFTSFTAYVEGWALYAERLGSDLGLYTDPYSKFGQLTYEMWRAVRLVVDTGMHSMRWKRQKAIDFFAENTAKTEHDIANEVDRYISWPGQALAYKIGELKIRELRERAVKELGEAFDLREFHDVILRQGAVPLDVLEEIVDAWLAGKK
jgi:prolyl oligopeptidase